MRKSREQFLVLTAVPTDLIPCCANSLDSAVMIIYATIIIVAEVRKSFLRPTRSTSNAAPTAIMRLKRLRNPLSRVCCVTDVTPIVSRIMAR
jgi:hypothetical protein